MSPRAWIGPALCGALAWLAGCPTTADDDDSAAGDDDDDGWTHAVVVTTDYAVGALATVALDDLAIDDEISATSGDPVVRADGGWVLQINRFMFDSVRVFDPPDLRTPAIELSTGAGSNPHDAAVCAGAVFVARYDEPALGIYDLTTGLSLGAVDLAPWADADGLPEADSLARIGDTLYVALQRLDRDAVFAPADGGGRVVEIDCVTRAVTRSWETGTNVVVRRHPARDDALLLLEGIYYEDEQIALDGGVRVLDLAAGETGPRTVEEADLGGNVVALDGAGDRGVLVSSEDDLHRVFCVDLTDWTLEEAWSTGSYIPEVAVDDRGRAWIVHRRGWLDPTSGGGLAVLDLATCDEVTDGDLLELSLDPYSVAFF